MHRKSRLFQVALKINAGFVDELLIFLRTVDLGKAGQDGSAPRPLQIDVNERVGSWE